MPSAARTRLSLSVAIAKVPMDLLHFEGTTTGRTSRWPPRVSCGTPASPPPAPMCASTRRRAGYGRYDESTATRLGRRPEQLLADYGGDLRRLRPAGHAEPAALSRLLRAFPGIGPAGAQIFLRELQGIWSLPPVFDARRSRARAGRGCQPSPRRWPRWSPLPTGRGSSPRSCAARRALRVAEVAPDARGAGARQRPCRARKNE